jgi:hypothetical protein
MTVDEVRPGDVVLDGSGKCWLRSEGMNSWSTFAGPVMHFGPWKPAYGPQGKLKLLVRNGRPAGWRGLLARVWRG